MDALIRAAGGVLCRPGPQGLEIALVHRPRLDDWSLPKGKLHRGEHPLVGACREVWEETGIHPVLTGRLPMVSYQVLVGQRPTPKTVQYFVMRVGSDDGFVPGAETDVMQWLPVAPALDRLSYPRDAMVVRTLAARPAVRAPVVLLRHASAGSSAEWSGPDAQRPLDKDGEARAAQLREVLGCFAPQRLVSASPLRCTATLAPLAEALARNVEVDPVFDEDADPIAAAARVVGLTGSAASEMCVVCSQGALIPRLLAQLSGGDAAAYRTAKGEGWLFSLGVNGRLVALDPLG